MEGKYERAVTGRKSAVCAHCGKGIFVEMTYAKLVERAVPSEADGTRTRDFPECKVWGVISFTCPRCGDVNMYLGVSDSDSYFRLGALSLLKQQRLYPDNRESPATVKAPEEVPRELAQDYEEAHAVLPISPKASAALSRRCLQLLLMSAAEVKKRDLANQIDEVIGSGKLPSHLVDAIRNIGNYAAHPMKSKSTGEIVEVEPGEAEWNLEVLSHLFDFYYVQPRRNSERIQRLNDKLADIGKPPIKGS